MECILRLHCSMDLRIKEHSHPVLFLFLQFHLKDTYTLLEKKIVICKSRASQKFNFYNLLYRHKYTYPLTNLIIEHFFHSPKDGQREDIF